MLNLIEFCFLENEIEKELFIKSYNLIKKYLKIRILVKNMLNGNYFY